MDIDAELDQLEQEIEEVRILYEKYFAGVDRIEPSKARKDMKVRLRRLQSAFIRNTSHTFRLGSLQARIISYESLWNRILRQIEDGTYKRDRFKMELHQKSRSTPKVTQQSGEVAASIEVPVSPGATPMKPAATASASGMGEIDRMRLLYDTYVKARKRCGEQCDIRFEAMVKSLDRQVPDLQKKYNCAAIDFKVIIKGGKASLKAVPRK